MRSPSPFPRSPSMHTYTHLIHNLMVIWRTSLLCERFQVLRWAITWIRKDKSLPINPLTSVLFFNKSKNKQLSSSVSLIIQVAAPPRIQQGHCKDNSRSRSLTTMREYRYKGGCVCSGPIGYNILYIFTVVITGTLMKRSTPRAPRPPPHVLEPELVDRHLSLDI